MKENICDSWKDDVLTDCTVGLSLVFFPFFSSPYMTNAYLPGVNEAPITSLAIVSSIIIILIIIIIKFFTVGAYA